MEEACFDKTADLSTESVDIPTKRCLFCGKTLDPAVTICPACGSAKFVCEKPVAPAAPQETPVIPPEMFSPVNSTPTPQPAKKSGGLNTTGIVVCVMLILMALVLVLVMVKVFNDRGNAGMNGTTTTAATTQPTTPLPENCVHTYSTSVLVNPTYSKAGRMMYTCSQCFHSYYEDIPALTPEVKMSAIGKTTEYDPTVADGYPEGKRMVMLAFQLWNNGTKAVKSVKADVTISCAGHSITLTYEYISGEHGSDILPGGYVYDLDKYFTCSSSTQAILNPLNAAAKDAIYNTPFSELQFEIQITDIQFVE